MITPQNPDLAVYLKDDYDEKSLAALRSFLASKKALSFAPLPTGLFSAASTTEFSQSTNYHASWVRDNVHVAYAHLVTGKPEVAANVARAFCKFFATPSQRQRFEAIIANPTRKDMPGEKDRFDAMIKDPSQKDRIGETMPRPHVRFDGARLEEILTQWWDHAQNDALGYFLWLYGEVVLYPLRSSPASAPLIQPADWQQNLETLNLLVRYFEAIKYWQDADGGHWEEVRKIEASSIGPIVAGLKNLREWHARIFDITAGHERSKAYLEEFRAAFPRQWLDDLIDKGEKALYNILPRECSQGTHEQRRDYDSALLFLIYPLNVVDWPMADILVSRTIEHLQGDIGIKRYLGDSFYCTDYERLTAERKQDPTSNFSQDMGARNAFLAPGGEAQWCLFDSIISVVFGRRYRISKSKDDRRRQIEYLNRALGQITRADPPRCGAFECPELFYLENGKRQTSKSTPLLWTQANLLTALETLRQTLEMERA